MHVVIIGFSVCIEIHNFFAIDVSYKWWLVLSLIDASTFKSADFFGFLWFTSFGLFDTFCLWLGLAFLNIFDFDWLWQILLHLLFDYGLGLTYLRIVIFKLSVNRHLLPLSHQVLNFLLGLKNFLINCNKVTDSTHLWCWPLLFGILGFSFLNFGLIFVFIGSSFCQWAWYLSSMNLLQLIANSDIRFVDWHLCVLGHLWSLILCDHCVFDLRSIFTWRSILFGHFWLCSSWFDFALLAIIISGIQILYVVVQWSSII